MLEEHAGPGHHRTAAARLHPAGNTSLLGAKLALFTEPDADFGALRARIEHVPLASNPAFQEIFIRETAFPESST